MNINQVKYFENKWNKLGKEQFSDLLNRRGIQAVEVAIALEKMAFYCGIEILLPVQSV